MKIRQLLATKGIHFFVTRFGWRKLRALAFDEKYRRGDWDFGGDGASELPSIVTSYLRNGRHLLIAGCGNASIVDGLASDSYDTVVGFDLSKEAIRIASRHASDRVSFVVADMTKFEPQRGYDVILFSESLYYLAVPAGQAFLRRWTNYLSPGGVFIVTIAQPDRYAPILESIRRNFTVLEDRTFTDSKRHLIVFN